MSEVDDFDLSQPSQLGNLFGGGAQAGGGSLVYNPPKQISPPPAGASSAPTVAHMCPVLLYKFDKKQNRFVSLGNVGAAIVHGGNVYHLLLYLSQQQHVAQIPITRDFSFMTQANNYVTVYDQQKMAWSLLFKSQAEVSTYCEYIAMARFFMGGGKHVIVQDKVVGTGDPLEVGDRSQLYVTTCVRGSGLSKGQQVHAFGTPQKQQRLKVGHSEGKLPLAVDAHIIGMRKNGVRFVVMPPELAFDAAHNPGVPADAVLLSEIGISRVKRARADDSASNVSSDSGVGALDASPQTVGDPFTVTEAAGPALEVGLSAVDLSVTSGGGGAPTTDPHELLRQRMAKLGVSTIPGVAQAQQHQVQQSAAPAVVKAAHPPGPQQPMQQVQQPPQQSQQMPQQQMPQQMPQQQIPQQMPQQQMPQQQMPQQMQPPVQPMQQVQPQMQQQVQHQIQQPVQHVQQQQSEPMQVQQQFASGLQHPQSQMLSRPTPVMGSPSYSYQPQQQQSPSPTPAMDQSVGQQALSQLAGVFSGGAGSQGAGSAAGRPNRSAPLPDPRQSAGNELTITARDPNTKLVLEIVQSIIAEQRGSFASVLSKVDASGKSLADSLEETQKDLFSLSSESHTSFANVYNDVTQGVAENALKIDDLAKSVFDMQSDNRTTLNALHTDLSTAMNTGLVENRNSFSSVSTRLENISTSILDASSETRASIHSVVTLVESKLAEARATSETLSAKIDALSAEMQKKANEERSTQATLNAKLENLSKMVLETGSLQRDFLSNMSTKIEQKLSEAHLTNTSATQQMTAMSSAMKELKEMSVTSVAGAVADLGQLKKSAQEEREARFKDREELQKQIGLARVAGANEARARAIAETKQMMQKVYAVIGQRLESPPRRYQAEEVLRLTKEAIFSTMGAAPAAGPVPQPSVQAHPPVSVQAAAQQSRFPGGSGPSRPGPLQSTSAPVSRPVARRSRSSSSEDSDFTDSDLSSSEDEGKRRSPKKAGEPKRKSRGSFLPLPTKTTEREERDRKEREDRARKEREERDRKEREEVERKARGQRERREREEREERERRERADRERKEREEREEREHKDLADQRENQRRVKEEQDRVEEERRVKEEQDRVEEERRVKEEQDRVEEERRVKEEQDRVEEERRVKEEQDRVEEERRVKEEQERSKPGGRPKRKDSVSDESDLTDSESDFSDSEPEDRPVNTSGLPTAPTQQEETSVVPKNPFEIGAEDVLVNPFETVSIEQVVPVATEPAIAEVGVVKEESEVSAGPLIEASAEPLAVAVAAEDQTIANPFESTEVVVNPFESSEVVVEEHKAADQGQEVEDDGEKVPVKVEGVAEKVEDVPVEVEDVAEKVEDVPVEVEDVAEKVEDVPVEVEDVAEKVEDVPVEVEDVAEKVEDVPVEVEDGAIDVKSAAPAVSVDSLFGASPSTQKPSSSGLFTASTVGFADPLSPSSSLGPLGGTSSSSSWLFSPSSSSSSPLDSAKSTKKWEEPRFESLSSEKAQDDYDSLFKFTSPKSSSPVPDQARSRHDSDADNPFSVGEEPNPFDNLPSAGSVTDLFSGGH